MRFLSLITAGLLLAAGCKKEKVDNPTRLSLMAKWNLVRITGGLAGLNMTAAEWGHSQTYQFGNSNKCIYTFDGKVTNTTYSFERGPSYTRGVEADFVLIKNPEMKYEFYFAHDTLVLAQDARVDGTAEWYVKAN